MNSCTSTRTKYRANRFPLRNSTSNTEVSLLESLSPAWCRIRQTYQTPFYTSWTAKPHFQISIYPSFVICVTHLVQYRNSTLFTTSSLRTRLRIQLRRQLRWRYSTSIWSVAETIRFGIRKRWHLQIYWKCFEDRHYTAVSLCPRSKDCL